jgi:hypothetical protein
MRVAPPERVRLLRSKCLDRAGRVVLVVRLVAS